MIEVYLYGKLRRFTDNEDPSHNSVIYVPAKKDNTIKDIVRRIGIPLEEIGSNIFHNGRIFPLEREVKDGDRLGIFPENMAMVVV